jgi:hypothetical protein
VTPRLAALAKRLDRLESRRRPAARRVFRIIVDRDETDAAVAALHREHVITRDDLIIVRQIMPDPRPQ